MNLRSEQQAKEYLLGLVNNVRVEAQLQGALNYQGINDPIAKTLSLEVKEEKLDFDEGLYIPKEKKIIINSRISDPDRRNFTFFHEITHHIIENDGSIISFIAEYASDKDYNAILERFCNIGAAEFIIPASDMRNLIKNRGFNVRFIEELEMKYPASKPAIAIQMACCTSHKCFIVICEYGIPPKKNHQDQISYLPIENIKCLPGLYILYAAQSPSVDRYSIGRFTPIKSGHIIERAYLTQSHIIGRDNIPFRSNTEWIVDCEAFFLKGKVYAIFNLTPPPNNSSLQIRMFDD